MDARASGKVGVCIALGPRRTNLITGIANAYMDSVPMVRARQVPTTALGTDAFQEIDAVGMTLPIVKQAPGEDVATLPSVVAEAFRIAQRSTGSVLIDTQRYHWRVSRWRDLCSGRQHRPHRALNPSPERLIC